MIKWLAALTHAFKAVAIIKPRASRSTNSELYAVCRSFTPPESTSTNAETYMDIVDGHAQGRLVVCKEWAEGTRSLLEGYAREQAASILQVMRLLKTTPPCLDTSFFSSETGGEREAVERF